MMGGLRVAWRGCGFEGVRVWLRVASCEFPVASGTCGGSGAVVRMDGILESREEGGCIERDETVVWGGMFGGDVARAVCAECDEEEDRGDEGFGNESASGGGIGGEG